MPRSQAENRMLDTHEPTSTLSLSEKGRLKSLFRFPSGAIPFDILPQAEMPHVSTRSGAGWPTRTTSRLARATTTTR